MLLLAALQVLTLGRNVPPVPAYRSGRPGHAPSHPQRTIRGPDPHDPRRWRARIREGRSLPESERRNHHDALRRPRARTRRPPRGRERDHLGDRDVVRRLPHPARHHVRRNRAALPGDRRRRHGTHRSRDLGRAPHSAPRSARLRYCRPELRISGLSGARDRERHDRIGGRERGVRQRWTELPG